MYAIFEQGKGKGVGLSLNGFIERFEQICKDHIAHDRAKAFAFIFYDFTDNAAREILKNQGVFAKLDRLSSNKLTIFYLHSAGKNPTEKFNDHFLKLLGFDDKTSLPCVVFFEVDKDALKNIKLAYLENFDLINGLSSISNVFEAYIENTVEPQIKRWKFIKSTAIAVAISAVKIALGKLF